MDPERLEGGISDPPLNSRKRRGLEIILPKCLEQYKTWESFWTEDAHTSLLQDGRPLFHRNDSSYHLVLGTSSCGSSFVSLYWAGEHNSSVLSYSSKSQTLGAKLDRSIGNLELSTVGWHLNWGLLWSWKPHTSWGLGNLQGFNGDHIPGLRT